MKKTKVFLTISLIWIITCGYLVWANGLLARGDKSFMWDEWFWFGIVLGLVFYIKKKGEISRPSKAFKKI